MREGVDRVMEAAITPENHETDPGKGRMTILFTKFQDLCGQLFGSKRRGGGELEEPEASHQPFKMIVFEADLAFFHLNRLKKTISVSETPVISGEDRFI